MHQYLYVAMAPLKNLIALPITPTALVGDLDSVKEPLKHKFKSIMYHDPDQNTNDLTKAVKWCLNQRIKNIVIVGATGKREDHTLGNIGLFATTTRMGAHVTMLTDTGTLKPLLASATIESLHRQQVSIFSPNNQTINSTKNLKYPIVKPTHSPNSGWERKRKLV
jgi:thiamine pyrophosphokinase